MPRIATKAQRDIVFLAQEGKCARCGLDLQEQFEVDHVQPFIEKGVTELWNLQGLCLQCHRSKTSAEVKRRRASGLRMDC